MRSFLTAFLTVVALAVPAGAQTLERIKETKQLNLGYRLDAAPMSYQLESGEPAGYTPLVCVRVAQEIVNHLKMDDLQVQFVPVGVQDRFEKVANGEVDLHCGAATITLERRALVDFSIPTFVDGTALILPVAASEQLGDLAGKKLGVRRDTTTETALVNSLKLAGFEAELVRFSSHGDGMRAMENAEIDAYFADQSILVGLIAKSAKAKDFKMSTEILTVEKHGLAMARGDTEFRLIVDRALSSLYAKGEMQKVMAEAIPNLQPGLALRAMFLLAPIVE
ncbi:amino acid ABC transporter substrate-binding protein [Shimia sp. W99]